MAYDKDKIKNSLTIDEVYTLVEEFGGNPSMQGSMLVLDTICHHAEGEGSKKLYYYDNTKLFKCYTGCGDYFDIYELVIKVFSVQYGDEIELPRAVSYVANKFGKESYEDNGFEEYMSQDWVYFKSLERLQKKSGTDKSRILKEYNSDILERTVQARILPWINEGISRETMRRYEISYYPKECQIVIPHRDINDRLIGVRARTLVKEDGEKYGKYRPIIMNGRMYTHPLGFNLYGLSNNKKNISCVKKAIIFEGEKSVMLYDSYFGAENNISVASCGSSITQHQFELLLSLGVQEIVVAFDRQYVKIGDEEHQKLVKSLTRIANKYKNYVRVSFIFDKGNALGYKSSPIDHGKEVFIELFKNRVFI